MNSETFPTSVAFENKKKRKTPKNSKILESPFLVIFSAFFFFSYNFDFIFIAFCVQQSKEFLGQIQLGNPAAIEKMFELWPNISIVGLNPRQYVHILEDLKCM